MNAALPSSHLCRCAVLLALSAGSLLANGCASSGGSVPTPRAAPQPLRTVAVLPLTGGTGMEGLGFALAEILSRDLALVPRVRVVERARLDAVLKELGLATSGRVVPQSVPRAGQMVGAERLLSGDVNRSGTGATVDVSLLDVQTGTTQPVFSERMELNGIIDAQERLAERAFQRLGIELSPAERERLAKRPTRRVDALIAFGNGRRADAMGNPQQARQFYAQAVRLDPNFQEASDALSPVTAPVVAMTPTSDPVATPSRPVTRQPFDRLLDELILGVTDRVVRSVAPPALCPPTCPALSSASGTIVVRIRP